MTTTYPADTYPVPAVEEIGLAALRQAAFLILTSPDPDAAHRIAAEVTRTVDPAVVAVRSPGPGFATLAGIDRVRAALLPVVEREAPELLDDEWLASGLTAGPRRRARRVGLTYLAESVTFAVTRRISRESHQAALIIDRIASTLLRVRRRCPGLATGLTLVIPDLHAWDRPSLRCLYRLVLLAEPADRLAVVAVAADPPFPAAVTADARTDVAADNPEARIGPARRAFLSRLVATGVVRTLAVPATGADQVRQPAGDPEATPDGAPEDYAELLLAVGDALVFQNYERVYHLVRVALRRAAGPHEEAQARRLIAIADAQLEDYDGAAGQLRRAVALSTEPAFTAHLHYLQGLIATKRRYDLDAAEAHYAEGIAALGEPDGEPDAAGAVEPRVERAWLYNGQALVRTLRAKQITDPAVRDRLMSDAFDLELRAFKLASGIPGAAPAYLRHNLMANLTFLLEVSRRFEEAVRFWSRAFEAHLAADSPEFQATFDARRGLLLVRAGAAAEGIAVLEQSRAACREAGDRFGEEELCLKLGYAYAAGGDPGRAYTAYRDALRIAHDQRELDVCLEALTGMLWSLADLSPPDSSEVDPDAAAAFHELCRRVVAALPTTPLADRLAVGLADQPAAAPMAVLTAAGVGRPRPSPKLRAYIPSVDLEGTPTQDLNRYLAWGGGPLSGTAAAPPAAPAAAERAR